MERRGEGETANSIPMLRVTAAIGSRKVYMLHIGVGDSPAYRDYHPAGKRDSSDDGVRQRFLDSVQGAR